MRGQRCPEEMRNPPDSESGGIHLSLVIVDSHLLTGAPLKGGCRCPQLTYCQTIDVDGCGHTVKLQSVVGFTGQKTQPAASQY